MAEDVNANIRIGVDTSDAISSVKALQRQIAILNAQISSGSKTSAANAAKLNQQLIDSVNATGRFAASMTNIKSSTEAFTTALEKNKLSMGQYFRYSMGATRTFGSFFRKEFDTIQKVAIERVKDLQTQYISMGRDANGALRAIKVRPLTLDMQDLTTKTMITAQKMQLMNQLMKQGSTQLLNWGKNTQWAGRQLMVGFTIPLTMFGTAAAKSFMEIEKQILKIQRVYGDFSTTVEETKAMTDQIRTLAQEYTKYGVAVKDTLNLAADAAAAGKTGQELLSQISEATRLAVLGNVEQTQALETTMSITNAFGTAAEDLAKKIDFLNAVENQSVTSIEDLTTAIPKAGPVVQQLGGDVEDLAFFLTAMKEGGINASEGANALKSGLASLINPTGKAKEMLQGFGINIEKIVESNKGDIKGLVIDFASALDTLDPLSRARAIEQLFGKFQFSRLSTLFQNVIKDGTQAQRVLELSTATTQELAILSKRELAKIEQTTTYKFEKAFADFQAAIAPVGEEFLKLITPVIEFGTKLLQQFNNMDAGVKQFVVGLTGLLGIVFPALLMTVGLFANGIANILKLVSAVGMMFRRTSGDAGILGTQFEYMTQAEIQAAAAAASLDQVHSKLRQTFTAERAAVDALTTAYQRNIAAQKGAITGGASTRRAKPAKYAKGIVSVPGPKGAGDIVPAMLAPGEAVIPAKMAKKYGGLINGMVADNIPGYQTGRMVSYGKRSFEIAGSGNLGNFTKLINAVESGAAGITNGSEVLEETFRRLSEQGRKISFRDFAAELMHVSDGLSKVGLSVNKVNTILGSTVITQKSVGQVPIRTYATSSDPIMRAELARAEAAAKAALEARKKAGLGPGQVDKYDPSRQQIDRAHQVAVSGAAKQTAEGWAQPFWVLQASDENQMSEQLRVNENLRKEYLGHLEKENISAKQKAEITRKINNGLALTDKELMVQKRVLERMLANQNSVLNTRKNQSLKGYAVGTIAAAGAREEFGITATSGSRSAKDVKAAEEKLAARMRPVSTQSPSKQPTPTGSKGLTVTQARKVTSTVGSDGKVRYFLGGKQISAAEGEAAMEKVAKADSRNAQAKEARANKPEAVAPKKPGIGSRIASGIKGMGGMGAGMGISMAGGAISMIPGLEGVGGALAMIGPLFMMLPAPIAGVIAGLGAMVGIIMSANDAIEKNRKATVEAANANTVNNRALNQLAEDLGTVSTTEVSASERDASFIGTTTAELSAGQQLLENSTGAQSILASTQTQLEQGATGEEAGKTLGATLTTAILQGIMTSADATSLAAAIAEKTGNLEIGTAATSQISQLTGNTATDVQTILGQNQGTGAQYAALEQKSAAADSGTIGRNPFATTGGGLQDILNKPEIAGLAIQEMNNYAQAVGAADVALADATLTEDERRQALGLSLTKQKEALEAVTLYADKIGSEEFGKYIRTQVEFMYPDDPAAQSVLTLLEGDTIPDGTFKTTISAQFAGGAISPSIATFLLDSAKKGKGLKESYEFRVKSVGLQKVLADLARTKKAVDIVASNTKGVLDDLKKGQITANRLENTVANTLKMQGKEAETVGTDPLDTSGTTGTGGGGGDKEDKLLSKYNRKMNKRQAALDVIKLQEDGINKKYDERKKALEEIAKLNSQISDQQKAQLDIANALASGDIAAAARAVQAERARAASFAQEQQMKALEEQRQNELGKLSYGGRTRSVLEAAIASYELAIAKREYKLAPAASGGLMGYSLGGKVRNYMAGGGKTIGSDRIPAMLTPGEFVIKRPAVQGFGVKNLEKINNGDASGLGSVYNYNVNVNVATNADADKIARTVVTKIRSIDKQRLGGNSY